MPEARNGIAIGLLRRLAAFGGSDDDEYVSES